jgi:hypothetical protein
MFQGRGCDDGRRSLTGIGILRGQRRWPVRHNLLGRHHVLDVVRLVWIVYRRGMEGMTTPTEMRASEIADKCSGREYTLEASCVVADGTLG